MKTIGIIQPGKIGDIIICLPIAKYYYDRGFNIIWPIPEHMMVHFTNTINYVKFIPIKDTPTVCTETIKLLKENNCEEILHLGFGWEDTFDLEKKFYESGKQFDEFKYNIANVPFEEKWNLSINRNLDIEKSLYTNLVKQDNYIIQHLESSDGFRKLNLNSDIELNYQIINIDPKHDILNGVFDWITILEKAKYLIIINSVFANLVNQLDINPNKRLYVYRDNPPYPKVINPILNKEWKILK